MGGDRDGGELRRFWPCLVVDSKASIEGDVGDNNGKNGMGWDGMGGDRIVFGQLAGCDVR